MFAASQRMNKPDGLEFTGDNVRAIASCVTNANVEEEKKQAAGAELRRVAETTCTPRRPAGAQAAAP